MGQTAVQRRALLPDLVFSPKFIALPGKYVVGQDITNSVRPTVNNIGQAACSAYSVAVILSTSPAISPQPGPHAPIATGRLIGQREVTTPLLPGSSAEVPVKPVRIPSDITWGDYFITVIVDPVNKVSESNEANNSAQAGLFIFADAQLIEQWYQSSNVLVWFRGKGFGSWKSSLVARVGPYVIPTTAQHWSDTAVYAYPPPSLIPPGSGPHDARLFDGDKAICLGWGIRWYIFLTSVTPAAGPSGTVVSVACCNCQAQGTKKLVLFKETQNLYEVPVISWENGLIRGTVPNIPAGTYWFGIGDGGNLLTAELKVSFTVN
jgi:hypothetical protein